MNFSKCNLYAVTLAMLVSGLAAGQTPNPNGDIVKMIQAGLPESTIVNKIREGAGHWDTSVDGLIVLKKAGATAAELDALTAALSGPASQPASAEPVYQGPMFMGGLLKQTSSGDPMLLFASAMPSKFLDGRPSNSAYLVTYNGEPAVLIPSTRLCQIEFNKNHDAAPEGYIATNVLFLKNRIIFDFYEFEKIHFTYVNTFDKAKSFKIWFPEKGNPTPLEVAREGLQFEKDQMTVTRVIKEMSFNSGPPVLFDRLTRGPNKDRAFQFDMAFGVFAAGGPLYIQPAMHSPQLEVLIDGLMNNFDATLAGFESAAGITDPAKQLSHAANYVPLTKPEEERFTEAVKEMHKSVAPPSNGNGALALLGVMQGVANMAQAQSAANVAAANHDMAGQMQAAMNAGRAEAQTLNAISNPNAAAIQPLAPPDPNAIQSATNQQLAAIQAKQAQVQAAQRSAATKQVARNTAPPPPVAVKTAPPSSASVGSGTAAPPVCADLGVNGNPTCITPAQYQQTMAQKNQQAAQMQVCPASGFVPGPGHYAACDAYLGDRVGCVPGQMVPVAVPAAPPAGCGPVNAGNGGGVSGGGAVGVSGTGAVVGDRAGCQPVNYVVDVQSQWAKPHDPDREVIYFVTNQTIGSVTCTVAFHKNGDWTEYGTGTYKAGATHVGGEGAGSWTSGADSSAVKYACYQGDTPLDAKGNPCNANLKFTGPTPAGTNWQ